MQKIIPKNLMPVTKKVLRKLKQRDRVEKALFILEKESYEGKLSIFSFPNTLSNYNSRNFFINPKGTKRLEWYIRQTQKRSDDLWGSFSEELISLRLRNLGRHDYEVNCGSAESTLGMTVLYKGTYLFDMSNKKYLKEVFYFGAEEMLDVKDFGKFAKKEIKRFADFLYKDFQDEQATKESQKIGLEADSIFFPN